MGLRNRIAFYFVAVTALLAITLFMVIYFIVSGTVYNHLDEDLDAELEEVSNSIVYLDNQIIFANNYEWTEQEHGQIEVNPTFIQVVDTLGKSLRKTVNLRDNNLFFHSGAGTKKYYDLQVSGSSVRQVQYPLISGNRVFAYLIIAIPLEESALVLKNLKTVLLISFPIVLILLFAVSRSIAGQIISPVKNIIITADLITRDNLNERIPLPKHKDELHKLSFTINKLLDRLEDAILREKQFTADASHELRTPISVIKGTLEVLIRKEREPEQYKEKVAYVIREVNRMATLVEQLLSLARLESGKTKPMMGEINLSQLVNKTINRFSENIKLKKLTLINDTRDNHKINADASMTEIIMENLISNSVKYSGEGGIIKINSFEENEKIIFTINNYGNIIPPDKLENIFDRFYRLDQSRNSEVQGNGLGLAIVKRLIDLQNFTITVQSSESDGTTFRITFTAVQQ